MQKTFTRPRRVLVMCIALVLTATLVFSASPARETDPRLLDRKITIVLSDVALEGVLKEIERISGVKIFYCIDQLNLREPVSIEARDEMLGSILDELLRPHDIAYKVDERKGAITLKRQVREEKRAVESAPSQAVGDALAVTGTVLEASTQLPMPGVNVIIKGGTTGTTTDSQGQYTIEAGDSDVLVFSFIGYMTFEAQVGGRSVIDVSLQADVTNLGEVVINAGYWKVTDRERTGNISRVTADDIKDQPVSNPLMAVQGRMSGVVITQSSGVPGSGMKIQIRGQNSLRTYDPSTGVDGNYPLYVIDGVPVAANPVLSYGQLLSVSAGGIDPLSTLNPNNIESIEILKDADATAIYGSRGANGVVLITTKKGKSGATDVDVQVYQGAGQVTKMMDVMNTEQYLAMRNEAFANDGVTPGPADYDLNGAWDQNSDTDWQKKLIGGTANISDVQASVSGGSASTSFRVGGGFHREGTVFPGDFGYKKMTGFFSLTHTTPDQKLKLNLSANYGQGSHNLFDKNIAAYAVTLPPSAPIYDEHGKLDWTGYTSADNANPMSYFETSHQSETGNLISSAVLGYEVVNGVRILANIGFSDLRAHQVINTPQSSMNPASSNLSRTVVMEHSVQNWIAEPQLAYNRKFGQGSLNILIGTTWQSNSTANFVVDGQGFVSDALLGNIRAASSILVIDDSDSEYRYNALFGRVGYILKDRYLVNLTARRDGSSRFGDDKRFGNFAAFGAGWIFSEEAFASSLKPFLHFGKVRASYGTTGSDQIGNYGYLSTYSAVSTTYQGDPILNTTALSNPDFAWEVNRKLEAAVELGFFADRIRLSTSWYRNRSSNQLVGYPLPTTTGFTSVQYNLDATVQNTGLEFELNTVAVDRGEFRWTTAFNMSIPRNELISYPNLAGSSYANRYLVGKPLTIAKRYRYVDVDPQTGLYRVVDVDGNGSYTDVDRQTVADLSRRLFGGLRNTVRFKSLYFNFFFEFVKQNASDYLNLFFLPPGRRSNQLASILSVNRWKQEGDVAGLQKFTQGSSATYNNAVLSDFNQTDASFIRLKTVSLAYHLPLPILKKIGMKEGRIYVQAQNLFTLSNYFGFNPESPYLELPPLRVFGGGVQMKF